MRDYRHELRHESCWDAEVQAHYEAHGQPPDGRLLQNRDELIALCEWMEANTIRSYLEIGVWTGHLITTLHSLFHFDKVAACDINWARVMGFQMRLPFGVQYFEGSSHSDDYLRFREGLGHVDLVMIDGDHSYEGVKRDFEINRQFPHRFLGFHDITGANAGCDGVRQLWEELGGKKTSIVLPQRECGLDHSLMGIGLWSAS